MNQTHLYLLFMLGCMPARLLYAYLINKYNQFSFISIIIGIMFIYKGLTWRGEKGIFGDILWWNKMRFIHGLIYIVSYKYSKLLYFDILLGFAVKTQHYLSQSL
jgi:hypothetical protein